MTRNDDIVDQAIAWHLHLEEASEQDWRVFVDWLAADEAHAAAYDQVTLTDASLTPMIELAPKLPVPANDSTPFFRKRWFAPAAGGTIAAALCAALLLPLSRTADSSTYSITTWPGVSRTLMLEDGTRIEMNGGTQLTLDHKDGRIATLDRGEAVFHVVHNAARPFMLRSGDATIKDLGTVFNVTRSGSRLDVGVAEGSVMFEPQGEAVTLRQGMQLQSREEAHRLTISRVEPESVGGWRSGRLTFNEEPLAVVAEAIERRTAAHVTVSPDLAAVRFSGVVRLAGGPEAIIPRVARLTGASWSHDGKTWSLSAGSAPKP